MSEALQHPEHWPLWEAVSAGHEVDWDVLFKDYASTTDTPGCNYYWDLSQHYPDAKVILSVRDPEAWFASTQNTVLSPAVTAMHAARGTKGLTDSVNWGGSDPKLRDRDYMLARYRRHNAEEFAQRRPAVGGPQRKVEPAKVGLRQVHVSVTDLDLGGGAGEPFVQLGEGGSGALHGKVADPRQPRQGR